MDQATCTHPDFEVYADVHRFLDTGAYMCDVRICCRECKVPMHFIGVPLGLSFYQPAADVSGKELHLPIMPAGEQMPEGLAGFGVRRTL